MKLHGIDVKGKLDQGIRMTQARFVDGYLLYLLAAASERASAQFHALVKRKGLKVAEWRVLACLFDNDGLMITELAGFALMEQSRMTRIIDRMDERGLVRRAADKADKRRVRVHLTDLGRERAAELVQLARQHEESLLSALAETDAARIKPVLQEMLRRLQGQ